MDRQASELAMADVGAIPIQNIYFLLCYAWDRLEEQGFVQIQTEDCETLRDLFAKVLTQGIRVLRKRGLHRQYVEKEDELSRLRGKIRMNPSMKRFTWLKGRMACRYDELNHDILHNQILKSSLANLSNIKGLSSKSKKRITEANRLFYEISLIPLSGMIFRRVQYHSNIRHYRFLLNVCELIYEATLPTEESGEQRFREFLRDPKKMPHLFESFVRNFYKQHAEGYKMESKTISWDTHEDSTVFDLLPQMKTDVTLESPNRKIIIDCKFYKNALGGGQFNEKFYSSHLYQILAYLRNQAIQEGWEAVEGILLYPAVNQKLHHKFQLEGHTVQIVTLDLNQPWQKIRDRLLELL